MPIFEFKCNVCGRMFEKIVFKRLEDCEIVCPDCQSKDVQKLISAPGSVSGSSNESYSSGGCSSCSSKFT